MNETDFAVLHPLELVEHGGTPFAALRPRCVGRGRVPILQKLDEVTAFVDEALAVPPDLTPLSAELGWACTPALRVNSPDDGSALRDRALAVLADLRSTLAISDASAAAVVGIARNTLASWRSGKRVPYPATLRRLFEVHSVVAAASALLGAEAGTWFHGHVGESTRLTLLRTDEGLQRLTRELRSQLFGGVGARSLPDAAEIEFDGDGEGEGDVEYRPEAYAEPIALPPSVD